MLTKEIKEECLKLASDEISIGDYIIDELINCESGQAVIFKARHPLYPKGAAIKVFGLDRNPHVHPYDDVGIKAGLNEIEATIIEHPSVVQYYPGGYAEIKFLGDDYQILYLPMEYASLGSCDCKDKTPFQRNGFLSEENYRTIIGLLEGLTAIHEKEIIHDDIKPANILKFARNSGKESTTILKITDFGVAQILTAVGTRVSGGSPEWMSPEQFSGVQHYQNDIYSMGATLYCLVTGDQPIKLPEEKRNVKLNIAEYVQAMKDAHNNQPRPNARDIAKACNPRLALLMKRMMAIEPDERPSLDECKEEVSRIIKTDDDYKYRKFSLGDSLETLFDTQELPIFYTSDFPKVFKPDIHVRSKSNYFVIQIEMDAPVFERYVTLINLLIGHFSDSFSLYETWGHKDVIILLWSQEERVEEFKKAFEQLFLAGDAEILLASDMHLFPNQEYKVISDPHLVHALAIQEDRFLAGLTDDIIAEYTYRDFPIEIPEHSVRAFTFIQVVNMSEGTKKRLRGSMISKVREIVEKLVQRKEQGERCFRKLRIVEFKDKQTYMCLVDFVATEYKYLPEVPTLIIRSFGKNVVKTATFLETRRVVFQSDKILFVSENQT